MQSIDTLGMRRCGECGIYAAFLMPGLDPTGRMTVAVSNGAPYALWRANASLYRPSFLTIDVPAAGAPVTVEPRFPTPDGNAGFLAVDPVRLVDTRDGTGDMARPSAGAISRLDVGALAPAGATAVALNLTGTRSQDG